MISFISICCTFVKPLHPRYWNFKIYCYNGCFCLHNAVDIKIGIIHKNRKNIQNCLLLTRVWCIVTVQLCYRAFLCAFICCCYSPNIMTDDWMCAMTKREPFISERYRNFLSFCIAYLLGLIAGALYITHYPFVALMRLLVYPQMSIMIGVAVSALPFVILYILCRCSAFWLIFHVAFFKAFIFMYCYGSVTLAFADAGWLVRYLLLFSDCLSVPILLWYAAGKLLGRKGSRDPDQRLLICIICILAIRCIDSYVVSPFALKVLTF